MNNGLFGISLGQQYHPIAARWAERVENNSGLLTDRSLSMASQALWNLESRSWKKNVLWVWPAFGKNLAAFKTPLLDLLGSGFLGSIGLTDSEVSENGGVAGNGTNRIFDTNVYPAQLGRSLQGSGAGMNGGLAYWDLIPNQTGTGLVMGCLETDRYALDLRPTTTNEFFFWGNSVNGPATGVAAAAGFYYGQRSAAAVRKLFRNGRAVATNTTSDTAGNVPALTRTIRMLGADSSGSLLYNSGKVGFAAMTDGNLDDNQVAELYDWVRAYFVAASGKI